METNSILLIEDDMNLRQSFALILRRAGYFVTPTDCICTAMDLICYGRYQMVITDINMPETRDVLVPRILGSYPNMSIVILTDQSISEFEKEGRLQSTHYLNKPVAPERLLDFIEKLLGMSNCSLQK